VFFVFLSLQGLQGSSNSLSWFKHSSNPHLIPYSKSIALHRTHFIICARARSCRVLIPALINKRVVPRVNLVYTIMSAFTLKSRVEGQPIPGDPRWYPGTICDVHSESLVSVMYIGVPNSSGAASVVETHLLRPCELAANAFAFLDVKPGLKCLAKYTGDGQWYAARVDDVTSESTIRVVYTGYGNTEIVPIEYIQRPGTVTAGIAKSAPAVEPVSGSIGDDDDDKDGDDKGIYAGMHIPENLRPLPTDGPEEKLRKRKKIKALKHVWRQRYTEALGEKKKSSWQSFLSDKSRKAPAGFISSSVAKESIFRGTATAGAAGSSTSVPPVTTGKTSRAWAPSGLHTASSASGEDAGDGSVWPQVQPSPFKKAR
jgi:hypothetical protein